MKTVKATREGLSGRHTATGLVIDADHRPLTADDFFVALPCPHALRRIVRVTNLQNARTVTAPVLDTGPWNTRDCPYVHGDAPPQAASGTDLFGRHTNGAGIDLSDGVWHALGMLDNGLVMWEFLV